MGRLSKTHFDHVVGWRPQQLIDVRRRIASLPDRSQPFTMDEAFDEDGKRHLLRLIVDLARPHLKRDGYQVGQMTDEQILGYVQNEWAEKWFQAFQQEYLALLNFTMFGQKVFYYSSALVSRLAETDLNVDIDLLRLPFPSCMFVFDDSIASSALFATFGEQAPRTAPMTVYISELHGGDGRRLIMQIMFGDETRFERQVNRSLLLRPETRIEDALRTQWTSQALSDDQVGPLQASQRVGDDVFFGPGLRFFRIIANAVLYLSSTHPDLSDLIEPARSLMPQGGTRKQRQQLAAKDVAGTKLAYVDVGPNLTPYREPEDDEVDETTGGRTLEHRIKVRPHWRNQAHGVRHSLRKLIYVEASWRGPEPAEVLNRPYYVR